MPRAPKYVPVVPVALSPAPKNMFAGTSGWAYTTWKPGFYPPEVPTRAFLHYYSSRFNSVEVNYTFRNLPERETLQGWLDATPPGFRFSFKAPEQITHRQRLLDSHGAVSEFVDAIRPAHNSGKLGALLFQLPPNFKLNLQRLDDLLAAPAFGPGSDRLAVAVEFRNASWFNEETYALLRQHRAALCVADSDELITPDVATAHFRYYRFRKSGGYPPLVVRNRAQMVADAAGGCEVFTYFRHEDEPTGAHNALALMRCALKLDRMKSEVC